MRPYHMPKNCIFSALTKLIVNLTTVSVNHKSAQKHNEGFIYIFHLIRVPLSFLLAHGLGHLVALALKTRSLLNTSEATQWTKQTMDFTSHRNITTRPHSVLRLPVHVRIKNSSENSILRLLIFKNLNIFSERLETDCPALTLEHGQIFCSNGYKDGSRCTYR